MNPKHQTAALSLQEERQMSANSDFAIEILPAVNCLGGAADLEKRLPDGWAEPGGLLVCVLRLWSLDTADKTDAVLEERDILKRIQMMGGQLLPQREGDSEQDPQQGGVYAVLAGSAGPQAVDPGDSLNRQAKNLAGRIDDPKELLPLSIEEIECVMHLVRTGQGLANPTTKNTVMVELGECVQACPPGEVFYPRYVGQTRENSILGRTGDEWLEQAKKDHKFVQFCSEFYNAGRRAFARSTAEGKSLHRIVFRLASVEQMEDILDSENAARGARGAERIFYTDVIDLVEQVGIALLDAQIPNLGGLNVAPGGAGVHEETHVTYAHLLTDISRHLELGKDQVDNLKVFPLIKRLGPGGANTHLRLRDRLERMATWRVDLEENTGGIMKFQPAKADVQSMGVDNSKDKDYLLENLTVRELRIASCAEGGRRSGGSSGGGPRGGGSIKWGPGPGGRRGGAEGGPRAPEGACVGLCGKDAGALEDLKPEWIQLGGPFLPEIREQLAKWGISLVKDWPYQEVFRVRTAPPSLSHTLTF